jgi:hypothetical protein
LVPFVFKKLHIEFLYAETETKDDGVLLPLYETDSENEGQEYD